MAILKDTDINGNLKVTGEMKVNDYKVFHQGFKPTAEEIGAVRLTIGSEQPTSGYWIKTEPKLIASSLTDNVDTSVINHNHDELYSLKDHNHNDLYSFYNHTHDNTYANINHSHKEYLLKKDIIISPNEPTNKDEGLIWFKYKE